jgi:CheY-like chemotaxis protein
MRLKFFCHIKADPALRLIPIIAVTSHALNGEAQTARAAGYVPEPYRPRHLLAKIRQYMPQWHLADTRLSAGNVRFRR